MMLHTKYQGSRPSGFRQTDLVGHTGLHLWCSYVTKSGFIAMRPKLLEFFFHTFEKYPLPEAMRKLDQLQGRRKQQIQCLQDSYI